MKIILLKDVPKVGRKFDIKNVSDGFAVNMLIPRGLAVAATEKTIASMESLRSKDMVEQKIQEELLAKNMNSLNGLSVTLKEKANEKGHLFAGVTKEMIATEILKESRLNIDPAFINLEKPIKEIGQHKIAVSALGKKAEVNVIIVNRF
jgi:large subunit ribosomal protein L9